MANNCNWNFNQIAFSGLFLSYFGNCCQDIYTSTGIENTQLLKTHILFGIITNSTLLTQKKFVQNGCHGRVEMVSLVATPSGSSSIVLKKLFVGNFTDKSDVMRWLSVLSKSNFSSSIKVIENPKWCFDQSISVPISQKWYCH